MYFIVSEHLLLVTTSYNLFSYLPWPVGSILHLVVHGNEKRTCDPSLNHSVNIYWGTIRDGGELRERKFLFCHGIDICKTEFKEISKKGTDDMQAEQMICITDVMLENFLKVTL